MQMSSSTEINESPLPGSDSIQRAGGIDRDAAPTHVGISESLSDIVRETLNSAAIVDVHSHLFDPSLPRLLAWGIDDLLTYHYLVAEMFRFVDLPYEKFWSLNKEQQADLVWQTLFLDRNPLSESCRGVVTVLNELEIDTTHRNLNSIRSWFKAQDLGLHVEKCLKISGVDEVYMTNSPFDPSETLAWHHCQERSPKFKAGLRIDDLLLNWNSTIPFLSRAGYRVTVGLSDRTIGEVRRFLSDCTQHFRAEYVMVSLPPGFRFPDQSEVSSLLTKAVLPHCADRDLPIAMMPGVRRGVNPQLRLAGDGVGLSDLQSISNMASSYPKVKFLATVLARENQHELCVLARKFRNLHIFGCWWFLNTPSLVEEITSMRMELLGSSFTAQHSDARVLEQLIYKWKHFKNVLHPVISRQYQGLADTGFAPTRLSIQKDVEALLGGSFKKFLQAQF